VTKEVTPIDTRKMKEKIGQYEIDFVARMREQATIYMAGECDQEFLRSLIPKR
jgi:hypothetical protein